MPGHLPMLGINSGSSGELIRNEGRQRGGCWVVEGQRCRRLDAECGTDRIAEVHGTEGVEAGLRGTVGSADSK